MKQHRRLDALKDSAIFQLDFCNSPNQDSYFKVTNLEFYKQFVNYDFWKLKAVVFAKGIHE